MKSVIALLVALAVLAASYSLGADAPQPPAVKKAIAKAVLKAKIDAALAKAKADYAKALAVICEKVIAKKGKVAFDRARDIIDLVQTLDAKLAAKLATKLKIAENPIVGMWKQDGAAGVYFACHPDGKVFHKRGLYSNLKVSGAWSKNVGGTYNISVLHALGNWRIKVDGNKFSGFRYDKHGVKLYDVSGTRQKKAPRQKVKNPFKNPFKPPKK